MQSSKEQLKLYRLLVENSLGLMCTHDLHGVLLSINPAAAQALGYRAEECLGLNLKNLLAPSVRHLFDAYLQRIRSNPTDSGLMRLLAKDCTERIWYYRNLRYDEPGEMIQVLGHATDITERIRAERTLKEAQMLCRQRMMNWQRVSPTGRRNSSRQTNGCEPKWRNASKSKRNCASASCIFARLLRTSPT